MKRVWTISTITLLAFPVPWLMLDQTKAQPASTPTPAIVTKPLNHSFTFPFLGRVKCHARPCKISFRTIDGGKQELDMTFCYTAKGQLLRAEYVKEGAPNYEASTEELESKYRQHNEEVVGIPNVEPHVLIEDLINRIRVSHELGNATRLNVTYVIFRYLEQPPQPVFILNVYGIKDTFFKGQDIEGLRKARYVFDADGNLIFFDNVI